MRHTGTKRAGLGTFWIDVDPLMIVGGIGKLVDTLLGQFDPFGRAEVLANGLKNFLGGREYGGHDGIPIEKYQACWLLTETISPVM